VPVGCAIMVAAKGAKESLSIAAARRSSGARTSC
jgi:hypothetical protein